MGRWDESVADSISQTVLLGVQLILRSKLLKQICMLATAEGPGERE